MHHHGPASEIVPHPWRTWCARLWVEGCGQGHVPMVCAARGCEVLDCLLGVPGGSGVLALQSALLARPLYARFLSCGSCVPSHFLASCVFALFAAQRCHQGCSLHEHGAYVHRSRMLAAKLVYPKACACIVKNGMMFGSVWCVERRPCPLLHHSSSSTGDYHAIRTDGEDCNVALRPDGT